MTLAGTLWPSVTFRRFNDPAPCGRDLAASPTRTAAQQMPALRAVAVHTRAVRSDALTKDHEDFVSRRVPDVPSAETPLNAERGEFIRFEFADRQQIRNSSEESLIAKRLIWLAPRAGLEPATS